MASQNTKVTAPPNTKRLSKSISPASSIVALSPALKSISSNHKHGIDCEEAVEKFFCQQGFELFSKRFKTPFAEVDLVFLKNKKAYTVEVKSLGRLDFSLVRITQKQKDRLLRARQWLESLWNCEVALAFAYVLRDGTIFIFNEAGEELNLKNEI